MVICLACSGVSHLRPSGASGAPRRPRQPQGLKRCAASLCSHMLSLVRLAAMSFIRIRSTNLYSAAHQGSRQVAELPRRTTRTVLLLLPGMCKTMCHVRGLAWHLELVRGPTLSIPFIDAGAVVGISCAVLILIFVGQRFGTSKIGFLYAPILLLWFLCNAAIGCYNIATCYPAIFRVSPCSASSILQHFSCVQPPGKGNKAMRLAGMTPLCCSSWKPCHAL